MQGTHFDQCPRCGDYGYEHLKTHEYCVLCDYAPEFDIGGFYLQIPDSVRAQISRADLFNVSKNIRSRKEVA